jgi:hypothetical protein
MDLVYICRSGDNEELRYSIRSAVKNLTFDNLWVVGGKPEWYLGNHIEVSQEKSKYVNARKNLFAICNNGSISEKFILMNDDFYIIKKVDRVPYMHGGLMKNKISLYKDMIGNTPYVKLLSKTFANLSRRSRKDILDYELHVPMIMEKENLLKIVSYPDLWRSRYGNTFDVGGIEIEDVKVYTTGSLVKKSYKIEERQSDYLSSNDDSFEMIRDSVLKNRFKEKSVYEA